MNIDEIKRFIPLKVKAETALKNNDYESAIDYIITFADYLTHYFKSGDDSYDALRVAYLGASSAALILAQTNQDNVGLYSRDAFEFGCKLYCKRKSLDNAILVVSSAQVLLLNVNLSGYGLDSSYYNAAIDFTEELIQTLNKSFLEDETVNYVVHAYEKARETFDKRLEHIRLYDDLSSNKEIAHVAAANALCDSAEFKYLYQTFWRKTVDLNSDVVVSTLHSMILNDESLSYAKKYCKISEVCTTEHAEDWDGFSEEFFNSYEQVCATYDIEPIDYYGLSVSDAIPFISNQMAYTFEINAIRCFLSLFSLHVPLVKDCAIASLHDDTEKICDLAEKAYERGDDAIGRFLLNLVDCFINVDSVVINNALLAAYAHKLIICMSALRDEKTCLMTKTDVEQYETECQEAVTEINNTLLRYINGINSKNIPNNLNKGGYDCRYINNLLLDGLDL